MHKKHNFVENLRLYAPQLSINRPLDKGHETEVWVWLCWVIVIDLSCIIWTLQFSINQLSASNEYGKGTFMRYLYNTLTPIRHLDPLVLNDVSDNKFACGRKRKFSSHTRGKSHFPLIESSSNQSKTWVCIPVSFA